MDSTGRTNIKTFEYYVIGNIMLVQLVQYVLHPALIQQVHLHTEAEFLAPCNGFIGFVMKNYKQLHII